MSTVTEKMIVRVEADTGALRSALEKGGVVVDQFSQKVTSRFSKVEGVFLGLGRTLAAAGIGVAIQQIASHTLDAVAALADLNDQADQLGISAEKIQELGVAALQNGSDIETMNSSLEQFTRRLGEAQAGSGSLLDVMNQYGVAVKDSAGKNRATIDVLNDLSDVLASVEDKTVQAQIASDAFGKAGAKLVVVLSQGADGLKKMGDEARSSGLIIDQALIDKASKFDDAWKNATYAGGVYFKTFAVEALSAADDVFQGYADLYNNIRKVQQGEGGDFSRINYSRIPLQKQTDFENVTSGGTVEGLGSFTGTIQRRMNNVSGMDNPFADTKKKSDKDDQKTAEDKVKAYKDVVANLKFEAEQLGRTSIEQEIYNNLKQAGVSASSSQGQEIAKLTKSLKENAEALEENKKRSLEFSTSFTQSMNNAILGTESLGSSLKSMFLTIANSALSKYVTGPAGNFLGEAMSSLFKFENGGIMTSAGSVPLRAYSSGGVATSPQLALYGEGRKPEAYVPLPDGRTIPVTMSGGGNGSSLSVVQHLHISTGVEQTTRAEIMKLMPEIRRSAVSAVSDASKRGSIRFN